MESSDKRRRRWAAPQRRVAFAAFAFFLLKGLFWLIAGTGLVLLAP